MPLLLYTYWEGPEDALVELCHRRFHDLNPRWTLIRANRQNCEALCGATLPSTFLSSDVKISNWFRFHALARTGGVWLDASCLCFQPLESWVDMQNGEALQAFEVPVRKRRIMATWALACGPQCTFMHAWAAEYHTCATIGFKPYRKTLPPYAIPGKGAMQWNKIYFLAHQIALKIHHEHPEYPVVSRSSWDGPLSFSMASLDECLKQIENGEEPDVPPMIPFYKINGTVRRRKSAHPF